MSTPRQSPEHWQRPLARAPITLADSSSDRICPCPANPEVLGARRCSAGAGADVLVGWVVGEQEEGNADGCRAPHPFAMSKVRLPVMIAPP